MSIKSEDPRVRKTRRSLREALIRLILRKGYDAIAIQDIADEAETARITFYRHYRDKEQLLSDCLNTLYDELLHRLEREIAGGVTSSTLHVRAFYEHLEEQEQLYRILFSSIGHQTVARNLTDFMAQQLIKGMRQHAGDRRPKIPEEILAYHLVSAHIGLGIWWLENDKPYPVDYLTDISSWLSFAGVQRALEMELPDLPMPLPPEPGVTEAKDVVK